MSNLSNYHDTPRFYSIIFQWCHIFSYYSDFIYFKLSDISYKFDRILIEIISFVINLMQGIYQCLYLKFLEVMKSTIQIFNIYLNNLSISYYRQFRQFDFIYTSILIICQLNFINVINVINQRQKRTTATCMSYYTSWYYDQIM